MAGCIAISLDAFLPFHHLGLLLLALLMYQDPGMTVSLPKVVDYILSYR
jgi:hypothetical protein